MEENGNLDVWLSGLRVAVRIGNFADAIEFCNKVKKALLHSLGVTECEHEISFSDVTLRSRSIAAADKLAKSLELTGVSRDLVASLIYNEMKKGG